MHISLGTSKNSPFSGHQGKFLTGPTSTLKLTPDEVNSLRIPKVFIPQLEGLKECHFLVYHAIQSTLCLLIPSEVDFTVDFFRFVFFSHTASAKKNYFKSVPQGSKALRQNANF